jgi:hypothetical protein
MVMAPQENLDGAGLLQVVEDTAQGFRDIPQRLASSSGVMGTSTAPLGSGVSRAPARDDHDFVISGAMGNFDVKDPKPCE